MTIEHGVLLTGSQLGDLHRSLREQWVLSVYLSHPTDNPAERRALRRRISDQLDVLAEEIPAVDAAQHDAFTRCVAHLGGALSPEQQGSSGFTTSWAAFVTANGIRFAADVPAPMPTLVRWGKGPQVAPYLRALKQWRPVTVAMVDSVSARLYRYAGGVLASRQRFDVHVPGGPADRLGTPERQGFHHGTRGVTAGDQLSQARVDARDHIARQVAQRVIRSASSTGLILGGHEMTVHAVLRHLPEPIASKALLLPGVEMHTPDATLRDLVAQGASALRDADDARLITELTEAVGAHGRGVAGHDAVTSAVHDGRARRVLLSLRFMDAEPDLTEEIVEAALDHAVEIGVVSGRAAERLESEGGGVMALLRFAMVPAAEIAATV